MPLPMIEGPGGRAGEWIDMIDSVEDLNAH